MTGADAKPAGPVVAESRGGGDSHSAGWVRALSWTGSLASLLSVPGSVVAQSPNALLVLPVAMAVLPGFGLALALNRLPGGRDCAAGVCIASWALLLAHWGGLATVGHLLADVCLAHLGVALAAPGVAASVLGSQPATRWLGSFTIVFAVIAIAVVASGALLTQPFTAGPLLGRNQVVIAAGLSFTCLLLIRGDLKPGERIGIAVAAALALSLALLAANAPLIHRNPTDAASAAFVIGAAACTLSLTPISLVLLPPDMPGSRADGARLGSPVQISCPQCSHPLSCHVGTVTTCATCNTKVRYTQDDSSAPPANTPSGTSPTASAPSAERGSE